MDATDGKFWYLPFEILISEKKEAATGFRNLNYLFKKWPVSYAYSASLMLRLAQEKKQEASRILAFAPANFDGHREQVALRRAADSSLQIDGE